MQRSNAKGAGVLNLLQKIPNAIKKSWKTALVLLIGIPIVGKVGAAIVTRVLDKVAKSK